MSDDQIRSDIKSELETISGLGGPDNSNITKYWRNTETESQFENYWLAEENSGEVRLNGLMIRRINRRDDEIRPGDQNARINSYILIYRLSGDRADNLEKEFSDFADKICNKIEGNSTIFKRPVIKTDGTTGSKIHPQQLNLQQGIENADFSQEVIQGEDVFRADITVIVPEIAEI